MADDLEGKARHVQGKMQEGVGELLGDRKMKRQGKAAEREGMAKQDAARANEQLQDAQAREAAARQARTQPEGNP